MLATLARLVPRFTRPPREGVIAEVTERRALVAFEPLRSVDRSRPAIDPPGIDDCGVGRSGFDDPPPSKFETDEAAKVGFFVTTARAAGIATDGEVTFLTILVAAETAPEKMLPIEPKRLIFAPSGPT